MLCDQFALFTKDIGWSFQNYREWLYHELNGFWLEVGGGKNDTYVIALHIMLTILGM